MNPDRRIYAVLAVTVAVSALTAMAAPARAQVSALRVASLLTVAPQGQSAYDIYNAGVDLQNMGKWDDAIKKYTEAIGKLKTLTDAYLNRGICYLNTGKFDQAADDFSFYIMRKPDVPDGYINRAQAYTGKKMYAEALKDYDTAVAKRPKADQLASLYFSRAATYYNMGDFDKSIADYGQYITAAGAKPDPAAFLNRGTAQLNKGRAAKTKKDEASAKAAFTAAVTDFTAYIQKNPNDAEGYINRAEANVNAENFAQVVDDITSYYSKNPNGDPIGYAFRAQAYLGMKPPKVTEATADINKAMAKDPKNPAYANLLLQLAASRYKSGDLDGAIQLATQILGSPGQAQNKTALTIRAQSYMDKASKNAADTTSNANAIKDYDVLITLDPKDSISVKNRGIAYLNLKQFDKAVADFDRLTVIKPDDVDALSLKGRIYLSMTPPQYAKAVDAYSAYLAKKPSDGIGHYNRGLAYYNLKQWDNAIKDLEAASADPSLAKSDPKIAAALPALIADSYTAKGDASGALKAYDIAIKNDPNNSVAYLNRAIARYNIASGLPETDPKRKTTLTEALPDFDKAIQLNAKDDLAYVGRAQTYFKLGQWDNAIKDSTSALAIKADNANALITRADASYNKKDKTAYASAIKDYQTFLALPGLTEDQTNNATEGLALAAIASGNYQVAVDAWTKVITKNPNNTDALRSRGVAYFNMKSYDLAIKDYDAYIAKKADDPVGYYNRGLAYKAKMDPTHAAADFEKAFTMKPSFGAANEAAQVYLTQGNSLADSDPDKAFDALTKAADLFGKAATSADKSTPASDIGAAYYNQGLALSNKARAAENKTKVEPSGPMYGAAAAAFEKYLQTVPNAPDKDKVTQLISQLKEKAGQ